MSVFEDITVILITEDICSYIELGAMSILFGFALYSLLSLLAYGIFQAVRLMNI